MVGAAGTDDPTNPTKEDGMDRARGNTKSS